MVDPKQLEEDADWLEQPVFDTDTEQTVKRFAHKPTTKEKRWLYAFVQRGTVSPEESVTFESKFITPQGVVTLLLQQAKSIESAIAEIERHAAVAR